MSPDLRPAGFSRAVFLDRDGVLIEDVHHLTSVDQVRLLPRVPETLARLHAAGWGLIIATNQSVVARGLITERQLREIHRALESALRARGAGIDAIYYCPHHPEGALPAYRRACECRKPNPGMLVRAANEWHLDLGASVIVGDAASDIEAGRRAGCRTVRIGASPGCVSGITEGVPARPGPPLVGGPDYVAADLEEAAGWIVAHLS